MEHILDSEATRPVFQHPGTRFFYVPVVARLALVAGLFSMPFVIPDWWISLLFFAIGLLSWWGIYFLDKTSYRIFLDRIEFFNKLAPGDAKILLLSRVEKAKWNNLSVNGNDVYMDLQLKKSAPGEYQDFEWEESVRLPMRKDVAQHELYTLFSLLKSKEIPVFDFRGQAI